MTLILSCLTPEYIVQVSDRRLTMPNGEIFDDSANKAIVFLGHACIAYTGIAAIGSQRTDEWITNQLVGQPSLEQAINRLKDALNQTIPRLRVPNKHLTVVIDWWGMPTPDSPYTSSSTILTNAYDPVTRSPSKMPQRSFVLNTHALPEGKGYAFAPYGQNSDFVRYKQGLSADIYESMVKRLYRAARRLGNDSAIADPIVLSRFMEEAVLTVASKNRSVGKNLMVATLYNPTVERNQEKCNTFVYRGWGRTDRVVYAPTIISPAMTVMGLQIRFGPARSDFKRHRKT